MDATPLFSPRNAVASHGVEFEFVVLGAGAIGSILGAHLARAGHRVAMLARGHRAEQVRAEGLRMAGLSSFVAPVAVLAPAELRSAGTLIVAMKTPGTAQALASIGHAALETVLSIQNGPIKNELLAEVFGGSRVLGALADTSGELLPTGEVLFTRNVNVFVGELAGGSSERAERIATAIDDAGVHASAVPDVLSREWSKFAAWAGLMPLSVTTRAPTWRYLTDPDSALVLTRLVREMGELVKAMSIGLTNAAVLPVATMCASSEADAVDHVIKVGREFETQAPGHRMSSLQDFEAGRPLEIHETLGYALRKATGKGVPLALVAAFYHLICALDRLRR